MSIAENIDLVKANLPAHVQLIAVSKTKPANLLMEAYAHGQRAFGENKVQELVGKFEELPKDIEWHFIGHLQTNKVKYIAPFVGLIHSIDSFKLLEEVNKQALKNNRIIPCLLQFYIATEESKFGFNQNEAEEMLNSEKFKALKNIDIVGIMGMASFSNDLELVSSEFKTLKQIFTHLKTNYFSANAHFKEISMGMSGDYTIAIEEGSTLVRIGTAIFGDRNYQK